MHAVNISLDEIDGWRYHVNGQTFCREDLSDRIEYMLAQLQVLIGAVKESDDLQRQFKQINELPE